MNSLTIEKRVSVLAALAEGNSINATCRMTGVAKHTVLKLLKDLGCAEYHERHVRNLRVRRVQCDEIWAFIYAEPKNVSKEQMNAGAGDCRTWTAIDADAKLTIGYGADIDYSMLVKIYGAATGVTETEARYSPGTCIGYRTATISGSPDPKHISTSFVERQNLSMRMGMRRFTRLTNAFSKKLENHGHAVALYFMHYNFCRVHKSLRVTPVMEAGLTNRVWDPGDLISLIGNKADLCKTASCRTDDTLLNGSHTELTYQLQAKYVVPACAGHLIVCSCLWSQIPKKGGRYGFLRRNQTTGVQSRWWSVRMYAHHLYGSYGISLPVEIDALARAS